MPLTELHQYREGFNHHWFSWEFLSVNVLEGTFLAIFRECGKWDPFAQVTPRRGCRVLPEPLWMEWEAAHSECGKRARLSFGLGHENDGEAVERRSSVVVNANVCCAFDRGWCDRGCFHSLAFSLTNG